MTTHEQNARARKIALLRMYLDALVEAAGFSPTAHAANVAKFLETMGEAGWQGLAYAAGVKEPSVLTRAEVIATYLARAAVRERAQEHIR